MTSESMLIMKNVSKTFNSGTVNEKCALDCLMQLRARSLSIRD